jgi:ankyrin repeat protein
MGFKTRRRAVDALSLAIATGGPQSVRRWVHERPELALHWRPLHEAAFAGRPEIVDLLLDAGADPDAAAPEHGRLEGSRPLHRAVEQHDLVPRGPGHVEVTRRLIARGADRDRRGGPRALRPLHLAALSGAPVVSSALRDLDVWVDVFAAAALGDLAAFEPRLAALEHVDLPDDNGMTALHYVAASRLGWRDRFARRRLREVAAKLLESGASVGDTPLRGAPDPQSPVRTALEWAVEDGGNVEVVRLLLERGADPNRGDLLHSALAREDAECASLLIHHGVDVDRPSRRGVPPLVALADWGRGAVVEWLLFHGADPTVRGINGDTALLAAVRRGLPARAIESLLRHGADPAVRDRSGRTAFDLALELGREHLVAPLRRA